MTAIQPKTDPATIAVHNLFSYALPMPGWKNSGVGARNGGADGLLKYCRPQAITAPRIPVQSRELLWYPYSRRKFRFALGIMRAAAAHGLRRVGIKPRGGRKCAKAETSAGSSSFINT
jgi:hypothetical protein